MKRTPLLTETKPRTPGSVVVTYLSSPPKPSEGTIGDIVVDVFTGTYFIKRPMGWTTEIGERLKRAIDDSTLHLEHKVGNITTRATDVSRAHYIIHTEMKASNIGACHRSGTTLTPGWAR